MVELGGGRGTTRRSTRGFGSILPVNLLLVVLATGFLGLARGQVGGLCACNPATITFEIRFDQDCSDTTIAAGDTGVENVVCSVANSEGSGTPDQPNRQPQLVSQVQILELDQNTQTIASSSYDGPFIEGDRITYTSNVANFTDLTPTQITKGLQMTLFAKSTAGNGCPLPEGCEIRNVWGVLFTNECAQFPIFELEDDIGWAEVVDFTFPVNQYCPGESLTASNSMLKANKYRHCVLHSFFTFRKCRKPNICAYTSTVSSNCFSFRKSIRNSIGESISKSIRESFGVSD